MLGVNETIYRVIHEYSLNLPPGLKTCETTKRKSVYEYVFPTSAHMASLIAAMRVHGKLQATAKKAETIPAPETPKKQVIQI